MSLMQIPRKIEYALRAMIHLADNPDGVARGSEIASHEHIPKYYLEKVIRDLMRGGLVRARRGPGGGYQLARPPETISFRDVIEAVEGPITLNLCVEGGTQCSLQPTCRMFRVWEEGPAQPARHLLAHHDSRDRLVEAVAELLQPHAGPRRRRSRRDFGQELTLIS